MQITLLKMVLFKYLLSMQQDYYKMVLFKYRPSVTPYVIQLFIHLQINNVIFEEIFNYIYFFMQTSFIWCYFKQA
jgi:hypothetical protein